LQQPDDAVVIIALVFGRQGNKGSGQPVRAGGHRGHGTLRAPTLADDPARSSLGRIWTMEQPIESSTGRVLLMVSAGTRTQNRQSESSFKPVSTPLKSAHPLLNKS
jgi:hypothetical protein